MPPTRAYLAGSRTSYSDPLTPPSGGWGGAPGGGLLSFRAQGLSKCELLGPADAADGRLGRFSKSGVSRVKVWHAALRAALQPLAHVQLCFMLHGTHGITCSLGRLRVQSFGDELLRGSISVRLLSHAACLQAAAGPLMARTAAVGATTSAASTTAPGLLARPRRPPAAATHRPASTTTTTTTASRAAEAATLLAAAPAVAAPAASARIPVATAEASGAAATSRRQTSRTTPLVAAAVHTAPAAAAVVHTVPARSSSSNSSRAAAAARPPAAREGTLAAAPTLLPPAAATAKTGWCPTPRLAARRTEWSATPVLAAAAAAGLPVRAPLCCCPCWLRIDLLAYIRYWPEHSLILRMPNSRSLLTVCASQRNFRSPAIVAARLQ